MDIFAWCYPHDQEETPRAKGRAAEDARWFLLASD